MNNINYTQLLHPPGVLFFEKITSQLVAVFCVIDILNFTDFKIETYMRRFYLNFTIFVNIL